MKIISFDLETTGTDIATDRIVQIASRIAGTDAGVEMLIDPGGDIPKEASDVHGITTEAVAEAPTFRQVAAGLFDWFNPADALLGFNLANFDIPLLWEEFYRAGYTWDLANVRVLDAGTLFKRREERTLTAAVKFYLDKELENAHDAMADVDATIEVWEAQKKVYGLEEANLETLEVESNYEEERVDLAGKIVVGSDGRPTYNIGQAKGTAVVDDPGFGNWMLGKDFTENTKQVIRKLLEPPVESSSSQSEVLF